MATLTKTCLVLALVGLAASDDYGSYEDYSEEEESFEGAQLLRIDSTQRLFLRRLIDTEGLDEWGINNNFTDVLVSKDKLENIKARLDAENIDFSVKIHNAQAAFDKQKAPSSGAQRGYSGRLNFGQYQRVGAIHDYMDQLAKSYPQIASVGTMGLSYEGRPMKYIRISSGKRNAKVVFVDGGIHAREWVAPATAVYMINQLVENRNSLPAALKELDFIILPVLNVDGYEYSHTNNRMWRKNRAPSGSGCYGTDLNRNFGFHWGGEGTSGSPCSDIYRGKSAHSEPETKVVAAFLTSIKHSIVVYLTLHSYGQYILIPYGHMKNQFAPEYNQMLNVGQDAGRAMKNVEGAYYTVGNTANTLYPAAGGSDDWTKANIKPRFVYTFELRDSGDYGFALPPKFILPTAKEAFEGLKVIATAASKV